MDKTTYKTWWALHLRVARNTPLNATKQAVYEAGLKQLDQEEVLNRDVDSLRWLKAEVEAFEAENTQLYVLQEKLNAEINALEALT